MKTMLGDREQLQAVAALLADALDADEDTIVTVPELAHLACEQIATGRDRARQLELLLGMLDDVWGIEGLVDINVEDPAKDYPLVLGELIDMARRTKEAERKWDEVAGDAEHVAKMADAVDRVADLEQHVEALMCHEFKLEQRLAELERQLAEAKALLRQERPWSLVEVLKQLIRAGVHLLNDHDCDAHGYELTERAIRAAENIVIDINKFQRAALDAPPSDSEEKC